MKASELRIGNLVTWGNYSESLKSIMNIDKEACRVKTAYSEDSEGKFFTAFTKDLEPIPLTEEWLLKFGFKKVGSNYESGFLLLWGNLKTGTVDFVITEPHSQKRHITALEFVHQLQNLYFAL